MGTLTISNNTIDLNVCHSHPIRDRATLAAVRAHRLTPAFSFIDTKDDRLLPQPLPPIDVFAVAFGLVPDPRINESVAQMFALEAAAIVNDPYRQEPEPRDEPGEIYVLHDKGDPNNVFKIGRSTDAARRRGEWGRALAPDDVHSISLLAAYPTVAQRFAERVVHEILRCQNIANRFNPVDNRPLEEFFTVDNFLALKLFLRETLRFINIFCLYWRSRTPNQ